jgi:flagellin-like hook-associated protein FlgL
MAISNITLTSSVRQNLLSLQSTASLLATTQTNLATGKKVNSALDNPTNFFTASSLDARANDISNLLDGIGNGVQVLQAANNGITSLNKLVDTAKSIANQALQSTIGFSTKSQFSTNITGATADNLLGTATGTAPSIVVTAQTAALDSAAGAITAATKLTDLASAFTTSDSIVVNGQTISFQNGGAPATPGANGGALDLATATVADVLSAIDAVTTNSGATASSIVGGKVALQTGNGFTLNLTGSSAATLGKLGFTAVPAAVSATVPALQDTTLSLPPVGGATAGVTVTFGNQPGQVKSLNDLNTRLAQDNLQASIDTTGKLTITTSNDFASATIGPVSGSAINPPVTGATSNVTQATAPVRDPVAQGTRATLVGQFNQIIDQLRTTAQDASFNGIDLLSGDSLKLTFNETGKSTLTIPGGDFSPAGLGLGALTTGTDFIDNNATNKVLASLNTASISLRAEASTLGANLSIVQIRQDFSKSIINTLQTGSSNLTLADANEEAANSQALSTRQSIAVSALALANQSNQSVLQLLR